MRVIVAMISLVSLLFIPTTLDEIAMSKYEAPADYHMLYDLNETLKKEDFITGRIESDGLHLINSDLEEYKIITVADKNIIKKVKCVREEQGAIFYTYYSFLDNESGVVFFNETPEYIHPGKGYSCIKGNCYRYSW